MITLAENKKKTGFLTHLSPKNRERLDQLAEMERRSRNQIMNLLIEREYARLLVEEEAARLKLIEPGTEVRE